MILRRTFLMAGLSAVATPVLAAVPQFPAAGLSFRIMRKGSRIGTHALQFTGNANALVVDISVEMAVRFGPIRLFHYNLHATERWTDGVFASLEAKTDYDGEPAWCSVKREAGQLIVEGSKASRYTAPSNVLAATHWNKAELRGPMINPENGELLHPAISDLGKAMVPLASGATVPTTHFGWRGQDTLDLWYDDAGTWTALRAVTHSGEVLSYERL